MTDEQLRAWAATQGEAGEAVLRVMRERDEARASDERVKAHLGDMLRVTGEACDALAVPNEGRLRFQLPHMARAMRDRAESAERERDVAQLRADFWQADRQVLHWCHVAISRADRERGEAAVERREVARARLKSLGSEP